MKNLRVVAGAAAFALTSALAVTPAFAAENATGETASDIQVTIATATCENKKNTITVTGLNPTDKQYRFVFWVNGELDRQATSKVRPKFYAGPVDETQLADAYGSTIDDIRAKGLYNKTLQMKVYYYDKENKYQGPHETLNFPVTPESPLPKDPLRKAYKLAESIVFTMVDPATLDCTPAAVEVSAPEKAAGEKIVFTGNGFKAGEDVTFTVHSTPVLAGTVAANDQGIATLEWTIPADFALGLHKVNAVGKVSQKAAEAPFTVVKPKETTPTPTDPKKDDPKKDDPKKDDPKKDDSKKVAPKPGTAKVPTAGKPAPKLAKTGADLSILFAGVGVAAAGALALVARRRG